MCEISCREKYWWENYPYHKIWCNDALPLVPRFTYRKGDEWNSNNWGVHWLILHVWTLEHFSFGLDANLQLDDISVGVILPYLRVIVGVRHNYYDWQYKLSKLLRRKPAVKNDRGEYN